MGEFIPVFSFPGGALKSMGASIGVQKSERKIRLKSYDQILYIFVGKAFIEKKYINKRWIIFCHLNPCFCWQSLVQHQSCAFANQDTSICTVTLEISNRQTVRIGAGGAFNHEKKHIITKKQRTESSPIQNHPHAL